MRKCTECGGEFMGRGRQKVCNICKGVSNGVQERVQEAEKPETKPKRPVDRFKNLVMPGQMGVRIIRRGT